MILELGFNYVPIDKTFYTGLVSCGFLPIEMKYSSQTE
jgi:hypothetical protein